MSAYKNVVDSLPNLVFTTNDKDQITYGNAQFLRTIGKLESQLPIESKEVFSSSTVANLNNAILNRNPLNPKIILNNSNSGSFQIQHVTQNGSSHSKTFICEAVNTQPSIPSFDIDSFFKNNVNVLVSVFNSSFQCVYINEAISNILGYSVDEYNSLDSFVKVYEADKVLVNDVLTRLVETGNSQFIKARYLHKNGSYIWLENYTYHEYDENGQDLFITISKKINDIPIATDQALTEFKLDELLSELPVHIWIADTEGRFTYANKSFLDYFDESFGSLNKIKFTDLIHANDLTYALTEWQKAAKAKTRFTVELRVVPNENEYQWFIIHVAPILNEKNEITKWIGTCVNNDSEIRSTKKMKELQEILTEAETIGKVASWIYYPETNESWWSDSLIRVAGKNGVDKNTITMQDWFASVHPEDRHSLENEFTTALETGNFKAEYRFLKDDNQTYIHMRAEAKVQWDEERKAHRFLGVAMDISEDYKRLKISRDINKKYELATKTAKMGIWEYYPDTGELSWDKSVFELFGVDNPLKEDEKKIWNERVHPEDIEKAELHTRETIKNGKPIDADFRVILSNGEIRYLKTIAYADKNKSGKVERILGVNWDITQIKNAELELIKLNETKDRFFSIIAHDLNGPISNLVGLTELLFDSLPDDVDEFLQQQLAFIGKSSKSASLLLKNLITWSRSVSNKIPFVPIEINLKDLISETLERHSSIAHSKKIDLVFESNLFDCSFIEADQEMLRTIMRNLLINAIKYSKEKSSIQICLNKTYLENEEAVRITVKDFGVGMSKDVQDKLFDINEHPSTKGTNKETGTGIGLLICKEFVELHRGSLSFCSTLDDGTSFFIDLPIQQLNGKTA
jgi:PAS domain S-box-containing protein